MKNLKELIRDIYNARVNSIEKQNIELEREYFTSNVNNIPLGELLAGGSFQDHFYAFKQIVENGKKNEIDQTFALLRDLFLFSYGHDLMFKKKLEADIFNGTPLEKLIYGRLEQEIRSKFNDVSILPENPKRNENIEEISKIVYTYTEANSLMYLLYVYEFQFPEKWEQLYEETASDLIRILNDIKIAEFLHTLVDYKCSIMIDILSKVSNEEYRIEYLNMIEELRNEKHEFVDSCTHINLPITYFKDHTFEDFLNRSIETTTVGEQSGSSRK